MYQITCDPNCGFVATDHNKDELRTIGAIHAANSHPEMKVSGNDADGMIKAV